MLFFCTKRILPILTVFFITGCVSLTPTAKLISETKTEGEVANCVNPGEVVATPPFVGPSDAKNTLRNKAAALGANKILITKYGIGTAKAQAYKCD